MKIAILLAAYGAGTSIGRDGIRDFDKLCRARFPGFPVRWAYTSIRIRERIAREKRKSDSVSKALMRLFYEKYDAVAIQPLQAIPGREYEDVLQSSELISKETGMGINIGKPLLNSDEEFEIIAKALLRDLPGERLPGENVIFMGHGARHVSVSLYDGLAEALNNLDRSVYLGTLSGKRGLDKILPNLDSDKVWLIPLLSLVGGHALSDMAGEQEYSWKSIINAHKHTCIPVLKGLSQCPAVSQIWLNNLSTALFLL